MNISNPHQAQQRPPDRVGGPARQNVRGKTKPALCYVVSPSYSGSTLLTFVLNTHSEVSTVGELKARQGNGAVTVADVCSCQQAASGCPFWLRVAALMGVSGFTCLSDLGTHFESDRSWLAHRVMRARLRNPWFESVRGLLLRIPTVAAELARVLERNRVAVDTILDIQQGLVFLDSSKDPVRLRFLLESGLFDLRVIHLVRDGRGTASSFRRRAGFSMQKASRRFVIPHRQALELEKRFPEDRWCRLHYEDLAGQPVRTMRRVFEFLGCEEIELPADFRQTEHHILGNPMRLGASCEIALDERWRAQLTVDDLEIFERFGGAMNQRLGYSESGRPRATSRRRSRVDLSRIDGRHFGRSH